MARVPNHLSVSARGRLPAFLRARAETQGWEAAWKRIQSKQHLAECSQKRARHNGFTSFQPTERDNRYCRAQTRKSVGLDPDPMNTITFRFPQPLYVALMDHLFPGDNDEHGAVIAAGLCESERGTRLLARCLFLARDGVDYVPGNHGYPCAHG